MSDALLREIGVLGGSANAEALDRNWQRIVALLLSATGAERGFVLVARQDPADANDPLDGWRPAALMYAPGPTVENEKKIVGAWRRVEDNLLNTPSVRAQVARAGKHRAHLFRDFPRGEAEQELFDSLRIVDRMTAVHHISAHCEIYFGMDRREGEFSEEHRAWATIAMQSVGIVGRWTAISLGALPGMSPLTPRERSVLQRLLGPQAEAAIADSLGVSVGHAHQVVNSIYRKLAVRSRAELMSLWLG